MLAAVGGLVTGAAALARVWAQNRLDHASAARAIGEAATDMMTSVRAELAELRRRLQTLEEENRVLRWEVTELRMENFLLRQAVRRLAQQVQSLGAEPVVDPDSLVVRHADSERTAEDAGDAE